MTITCIIASRNPARCQSLIAQLHTYGHAVIVVHPAPTIAPHEVISITTPTLVSPAHARNLGTAHSDAELLCFLDDDVIMRGDVPRLLASVFVAPHIVACGAVIHDHSDNDAWQRAFHRMAMAPQHHISTQRIPLILASMALIVRRTAFVEVGGFDTTFAQPAGEDADLSLRLRRRGVLMTLPQARIYHLLQPIGWWGVTQRSWRYGAVWPQVRRHNSHATTHLPFPNVVSAFLITLGAPMLALYDTARTRRSGYWGRRWWLRTWWYLGVAWGMFHD